MLVKDASPTNAAKLYNYNYIPGIASIYKTFIAFFSLYVTSSFHHSCLETKDSFTHSTHYLIGLYTVMQTNFMLMTSWRSLVLGFARHGIIINGVSYAMLTPLK